MVIVGTENLRTGLFFTTPSKLWPTFMAYKMGILPSYKGLFLGGSSRDLFCWLFPGGGSIPSPRALKVLTVQRHQQPRYSKVEPKKLINIKAFSLDRVLEMDPEFMDTETWRS